MRSNYMTRCRVPLFVCSWSRAGTTTCQFRPHRHRTPRQCYRCLLDAARRRRSPERIDIGDVIRSRVTAEDPLCELGWPYRCRYYGVTVPSAGWLNVTIGWDPELTRRYRSTWASSTFRGANGSRRQAGSAETCPVPVTAGTTYVIEVWSFWSPPADFQLTTSLQTQ